MSQSPKFSANPTAAGAGVQAAQEAIRAAQQGRGATPGLEGLSGPLPQDVQDEINRIIARLKQRQAPPLSNGAGPQPPRTY